MHPAAFAPPTMDWTYTILGPDPYAGLMVVFILILIEGVLSVDNAAVLEQVGLDKATVEDMYRVMAIANYEDRFVIPTTHREYAENAFNVRGGCGFSFGNGCSEGVTETSLFGSEKKRTIPIKAEV